jgi:2-phospho-L-lactate guanylyltransferase
VLLTGARKLLIVHADVPLVEPIDLAQFFRGDSKITIAPSRNLDGTNALILNPPDVIEPRYGKMSFDTHLALACKNGIKPLVIRNERIALDIDTPVDLRDLAERSQKGYTHKFMRERNIVGRLQQTIGESPHPTATDHMKPRMEKFGRTQSL